MQINQDSQTAAPADANKVAERLGRKRSFASVANHKNSHASASDESRVMGSAEEEDGAEEKRPCRRVSCGVQVCEVATEPSHLRLGMLLDMRMEMYKTAVGSVRPPKGVDMSGVRR